MFTGPTTVVPTLSTTTFPTSNAPSSRSSRLRGLNYLRNHTNLESPSNRNSVQFAVPITVTASRRSLSSDSGRHRRPTANKPRDSVIYVPNPQRAVTRTTTDNSSTRACSTTDCVPASGGLGGLSRLATQENSQSTGIETSSGNPKRQQSLSRTAAAPAVPVAPRGFAMTRHMSEGSVRVANGVNLPTPQHEASNAVMAETQPESSNESAGVLPDGQLPTIKFVPHQDPRSARPSLKFPAMTRVLPNGNSVIRVGRYSERDSPPVVHTNQPSNAPVGFKSKVVSRRHCEFWCANGQWYIKDVKSSSGTFLNHIRLSQPGVESGPWPVSDGDVIQLGIDFRGGEEMIFRCVKIRIECNRGWQNGPNTFNKSTYKRLQNMTSDSIKKDGDTASTHTSECSICLMSIAPCQSLFVAPCSHVWHYKCIRPILSGPTWPNFLCPNCRAVADLEADLDDPHEASQWEDDTSAIAAATSASAANDVNGDVDRTSSPDTNHVTDDNTRTITPQQQSNLDNMFGTAVHDANATRNSGITSGLAALSLAGGNRDSSPTVAGGTMSSTSTPTPNVTSPTPATCSSPPEPSASASATVRPRPILAASSTATTTTATTSAVAAAALTASPPLIHRPFAPSGAEGIPQDGPLTPRNDVGPFVLDGSGSGPSVTSVNSHGNAAAGGHAAVASEDGTERRRSSVAGLAQAMFGRRASADQSPWRR